MAATSLSSSISSSITLGPYDDFLPAEASQPTTVPAEEQDKIAPWLDPSFDSGTEPVRLRPLHMPYVPLDCPIHSAWRASLEGDTVFSFAWRSGRLPAGRQGRVMEAIAADIPHPPCTKGMAAGWL
ncbi:hypothetical protein NM688_g8135 [Phlebia brevispora]|uniref:Uncharacterized protein n=1 Tax=Phlebia brevispora TaxID=194682 RepID=A0ACC1RWY0_9APHY|nr:hypothetical protein NM688_g8135 [Phlebia brevispora]